MLNRRHKEMLKKKKRSAAKRPSVLSEDLRPKVDKQPIGVYIAGPMRGYPRFNFGAFDRAQRVMNRRGYYAISPAELDRRVGFDPNTAKADLSDFDMKAAVRRDVNAILQCQAVVFLPGWRKSVGARAEREIARWAGIPCYDYRTFHRIHK